MYPDWYVYLGRDGWIVGSWLNDPNPTNNPVGGSPRSREFMGREWMDLVANEIGAKGGSIKYSVEPAKPGEPDDEPPPIVLTMIHFMSDILNQRLTYVEPQKDEDEPDKKSDVKKERSKSDENSDADLTVLMRKAREGHLPWVLDLIERDADLEATDDLGCTALMHAAYAGHLEVVQALLEAGADPNRASNKGNTALMMAVQCPVAKQEHRAEVARALLSRKADPNIYNKNNQTALDLCDRPDQRVIYILREFGGCHYHELIPWYDNPWIKWPVGIVVSLGMMGLLFWLMFDYIKNF